jgi:hypothetical protein
MQLVTGDSAIVVRDLPLHGGNGDAADERVAKYDAEIAAMAQNARLEELLRGAGAEPDVLLDEVATRAEQRDEKLPTGLKVQTGGTLEEDEASEGEQPQQETAVNAGLQGHAAINGFRIVGVEEDVALPYEYPQGADAEGTGVGGLAASGKVWAGGSQMETVDSKLAKQVEAQEGGKRVVRRGASEVGQEVSGNSQEADSSGESGTLHRKKRKRKKRGAKVLSTAAKRAAQRAVFKKGAAEVAAGSGHDNARETGQQEAAVQEGSSKRRKVKKRKGRPSGKALQGLLSI